MIRLAGLIAVMLLASVAGCARSNDHTGGTGSGLPAGRTFLSTAIIADGQPVAWQGRIDLRFSSTQVSGSGGCNQLSGLARLSGGKLLVSSLASTDMACREPRMAQDRWLADFLTAGPTWRLDGDTLTLSTGAKQLTMLDREVADPDKPLAGGRWLIDTLISGDTAGSVPVGVEPYLQFAADRTFTGSDGCNRIQGQYSYAGDQLLLSRITSTKMSCADPAATVARAVNAVLGGPITATIEASRLTMTGQNGAGLAAHAG
jgi:heat shock protein HslJ